MKVGIFSDVHANLEALDAVVSYLERQGANSFACCGDLVGYGPDPVACIERIRRLDAVVVAGNHDYGVLGRLPMCEFNAAARAALNWTRAQLQEEHTDYLQALPLTVELGQLFLVHAAPSAPDLWPYILSVGQAELEMNSFACRCCVVGHSHYPFIVERRPSGHATLVAGDSVRLAEDGKYVVNAGSVGQPRDGDPRACCLLYDEETGVLSLHRVEYDIPAVQNKMRKAGLPEFLVSRLSLGR